MIWRWTGLVTRYINKWIWQILEWRPRKTKRSTSRPHTRRVDDIRAVAVDEISIAYRKTEAIRRNFYPGGDEIMDNK